MCGSEHEGGAGERQFVGMRLLKKSFISPQKRPPQIVSGRAPLKLQCTVADVIVATACRCSMAGATFRKDAKILSSRALCDFATFLRFSGLR
jgi:hypothetical protein